MMSSARKILELLSEVFSPSEEHNDSVAMLLQNAKNEIRELRANIDAVNDDAVLDMYIYRLKAAEEEYRHLLKMAKEQRDKKTG